MQMKGMFLDPEMPHYPHQGVRVSGAWDPSHLTRGFLEIENTHKCLEGLSIWPEFSARQHLLGWVSAAFLWLMHSWVSHSPCYSLFYLLASGISVIFPDPTNLQPSSTQLLLSPIKNAIQSLLRLVLAYIPTFPFVYSSFSQIGLSFNSQSIFHIPEFGVFVPFLPLNTLSLHILLILEGTAKETMPHS